MAQLNDIVYAIQLEATNPWIYTVIAAILGLLHPFEPGSSGEAVARIIRGGTATIAQTARTSVVAALQDTTFLWAAAVAGLLSANLLSEFQDNEPYILLVSGALIIVTAFRLFNLHQMKFEPSYLVSASAFAGLSTAPAQSPGQGPDMLATGFSRFLPGPATLALLLLCMQLDFLDSSISIALAFCAGLAASFIVLGVAGRMLRNTSGTWSPFDTGSAWLPYVSVLFIIAIGLLSFVHGLTDLGL